MIVVDRRSSGAVVLVAHVVDVVVLHVVMRHMLVVRSLVRLKQPRMVLVVESLVFHGEMVTEQWMRFVDPAERRRWRDAVQSARFRNSERQNHWATATRHTECTLMIALDTQDHIRIRTLVEGE